MIWGTPPRFTPVWPLELKLPSDDTRRKSDIRGSRGRFGTASKNECESARFGCISVLGERFPSTLGALKVGGRRQVATDRRIT